MKVKEYMRLGKISIKSRKKSTKNTVRGICFGLIMLIPVIFFTLAFYIGLTNEINANKTVSVFNVYMRNVRDGGATVAQKPVIQQGNNYVYYEGLGILSFEKGDSLTNDDRISEKTYSEYYMVNGMQYGNTGNLMFDINGVDYTIANEQNNQMNNNNQYSPNLGLIKVANLGLSNNKYFLDSENEEVVKNGGKILSHGDGFDLSVGGKQQVLISEYLLEKLIASDKTKPNADDIVGRKISLTNTVSKNGQDGNAYIFVLEKDDSVDGDNIFNDMGSTTMTFLTEFEIAGVISKDYYALPSGASDAHIMVTEKSIYLNDDKEVLEPQMTIETKERDGGNYSQTYIYSRYVNGIMETSAHAQSMGVMCLATGFINPVSLAQTYATKYSLGSMKPDNYTFFSPMNVRTQLESYSKADKFSKTLEAEYKTIYPDLDPMFGATDVYANEAYGNFKMLNTVGTYLMLVLYAFGGIIFFATMLNLYNSVNHSVESRRNYMGVMRAIGAKKKVIPKLYFFEILLIFMRALIWVLIFSAAISYGMKYLIDFLFKQIGGILNVTLSLNFAYYFVTLGIVILGVFLIALAFSQIACKHVAGKPILTVLSDDKG